MAEKQSLWNLAILRQAAFDSFKKLDPRLMVKNPVMLVVEIGSVLTTVLLIQGVLSHQGSFAFNLQITLWLWFTVLFANFAEAMAEGRGKAQADTLRKAKGETMAVRLKSESKDAAREEVSSAALRSGDIIYVEAGRYIPGDGEVIEGVASVDESAITGESAPVIREAGRRPLRSHRRNQGALRLDHGQDHLQSRRDVSGPHDCPGGGRPATEDAQ